MSVYQTHWTHFAWTYFAFKLYTQHQIAAYRPAQNLHMLEHIYPWNSWTIMPAITFLLSACFLALHNTQLLCASTLRKGPSLCFAVALYLKQRDLAFSHTSSQQTYQAKRWAVLSLHLSIFELLFLSTSAIRLLLLADQARAFPFTPRPPQPPAQPESDAAAASVCSTNPQWTAGSLGPAASLQKLNWFQGAQCCCLLTQPLTDAQVQVIQMTEISCLRRGNLRACGTHPEAGISDGSCWCSNPRQHSVSSSDLNFFTFPSNHSASMEISCRSGAQRSTNCPAAVLRLLNHKNTPQIV